MKQVVRDVLELMAYTDKEEIEGLLAEVEGVLDKSRSKASVEALDFITYTAALKPDDLIKAINQHR
jgi:hypothetical protein